MPGKERSSTTKLTTAAVARIFEVHPSTIRRWCKKGILKSYRSGSSRSRSFLREDVAVAYLDRSIQKYLRSYRPVIRRF